MENYQEFTQTHSHRQNSVKGVATRVVQCYHISVGQMRNAEGGGEGEGICLGTGKIGDMEYGSDFAGRHTM